MLLIDEPDPQRVCHVIEGLLAGRYSRGEVVTWQRAVVDAYGVPGETGMLPPQKAAVAGWYVLSMALLETDFGGAGPGGDFIREHDLVEYLLDIKQTPAPERLGAVRRLRVHQFDRSRVRFPLTTVLCPHDVLGDAGLPSVRGIFESHLDPLEHTHLQLGSGHYLIVRQYDDMADRLMVFGTSRDDAQLHTLLKTVGLIGD